MYDHKVKIMESWTETSVEMELERADRDGWALDTIAIGPQLVIVWARPDRDTMELLRAEHNDRHHDGHGAHGVGVEMTPTEFLDMLRRIGGAS